MPVQASLVDRKALQAARRKSTHCLIKQAFNTDVIPILAEARRKGGAIDPLSLYRTSGYRAAKAKERPVSGVASAGII